MGRLFDHALESALAALLWDHEHLLLLLTRNQVSQQPFQPLYVMNWPLDWCIDCLLKRDQMMNHYCRSTSHFLFYLKLESDRISASNDKLLLLQWARHDCSNSNDVWKFRSHLLSRLNFLQSHIDDDVSQTRSLHHGLSLYLCWPSNWDLCLNYLDINERILTLIILYVLKKTQCAYCLHRHHFLISEKSFSFYEFK